jgi:hypothetical protein
MYYLLSKILHITNTRRYYMDYDMNIKKNKVFNNPPQSYWIATTEQPSFPALDRDISVDVAIIGGGMVGITAAWMLKKEGV